MQRHLRPRGDGEASRLDATPPFFYIRGLFPRDGGELFMSTRRFLWAGCCVLAIAAGSNVGAQSSGEAAATPSSPTEEQKIPWWGGRFALYLETAVGGAGTSDVDTSLETSVQRVTYSTFDPGDRSFGRVVVGWQLPLNRGTFLLRFSGYKEDGGWELTGTGASASVSGTSTPAETPLPWWTIDMREGLLVATRNAPLWSSAQDADGDSKPDFDEVTYGGVDQTTSIAAPTTMQQRARTYDLAFQREFADKGPTDHWTGRWSGGLRHFQLEGAVPVPGWLGHSSGEAGILGDPGLFSEGALLRPLLVNQDTSGIGPAGTLELQFQFLRRRATAYAQGRAAFLIQKLSADSGLVYTLTRRKLDGGPDAFYPTPLLLQHDVDKTSWQVGAEIGLRFRLLPGLTAALEYHRESQQDVLLLPDRLNIPADIEAAPFGSDAIFTTQDIDYDGWSAGLSFQF